MKHNNFLNSLTSALLAAIFTFVLVTTTPALALRGERSPDGPPSSPVISYQGRISVNGQPHNGWGFFKFAIVSGETIYWANDDWEDGVPIESIKLQVNNGLFEVLLGEVNIPGMNLSLDTSYIFSGETRWLRIWFSTDGVNFTQLAPDRRLAWSPYAFEAYNASTLNGLDSTQFGIKDGALQSNLNADLLDGLNSTQFGVKNGALQTNLNADLLDGLHASSIVPAGTMVLGLPHDTALPAAGFTALGLSNTTLWRPLSASGAPAFTRRGHSAVWTGSEMIVWGGGTNTGARYNPTTDTWIALPTENAPSARYGHIAVWTGSEMIIVGGFAPDDMPLTTGARYNLAANTWSAIPNASIAWYKSGVWTGSNLIYWGGYDGATYYNTGASYNPVTNTWTAISTTDAPSGRWKHTAVWSGSEMLIWGGENAGGYPADGGRYNPATDTWSPLYGSPDGRIEHAALWTGNRMFVWGGKTAGGDAKDGALYNPVTQVWENTSYAPFTRRNAAILYTGSKIILWGGINNECFNVCQDGAAYDLVSKNWTPLSNYGAPYIGGPTLIWTGQEILLWNYSSGGRMFPELYIYRKQ